MTNDDGRRRNEEPYWIVYKKLDMDISEGLSEWRHVPFLSANRRELLSD